MHEDDLVGAVAELPAVQPHEPEVHVDIEAEEELERVPEEETVFYVDEKDFEKDTTKRRNDSPLRWIANAHHTTTHNERIRWLLYENEKMYDK